MKPIDFEESNKTLTKPATWEDAECRPLPVFTNGVFCASVWEATPEEMAMFAITGKIILRVHSGGTQPPVSLDVVDV